MGTMLEDGDKSVQRKNQINLELFDGEMVSRRLKNAFDSAGLKTWADVEGLSNIRFLKNIGEKSVAEAQAIIKRRHAIEVEPTWCDQCRREYVGVCPHYEQAREADEPLEAVILNTRG